ncbi:ashwin [Hypomesus transpacificus]|uniref:ashwin n=1 Tax=Hypomesus transpacificus TaxID=137520 RepID=UPI001F0786E0|nr:ashwin [Hypomesus transpacificus]
MASISTRRDETRRTSDKTDSKVDLLHPELLSRDFIQLVLHERNISTGEDETRDRLTELYLRHIIPLPQRALPNSRWGRKMERMRPRQSPAGGRSYSSDTSGKRPFVVFDGRSSHAGPLRVKKPEEAPGFGVGTDRLKPPPSVNLSNPVRRLTISSSSSSPSSSSSTTVKVHAGPTGNGRLVSPSSVSLKREADSSGVSKSPEVKKKIQHVTWP